ncbi:Trp biosynthesis-associated membrane protein [Georgenia satyanarayanai]|uniref:Trp biosynthesis-associated membrane protein n=1 Tax=Georgenia satyanarayanai TaxID=860221 RepID=UPI002041EE48|nr:Trp biosynthesis-associated membrane protein [Georgenia satyanarayanai]MCM3659842.1 Trp biosynthesis-associated membrane protein [Georgenia satyanarayanai]
MTTAENTSRGRPPVSRGRAVVVVLVLGAVTFGLSLLPWASATVPTVIAEQTVTVTGGDAAPATTATGLAVLATALAVALGGRWVSRLCAVALLALGALLAAAAVGFLLDPRPPLLAAAAAVSGVREISAEPSTTLWPWLAVAAGVLVAASAVLVLRAARTATAGGRRFERAPAVGERPRPTPDAEARDERVRAMDDWDALGRGEDPTEPEHR